MDCRLGKKKRNDVRGKPRGDLSALQLGGGNLPSLHKVQFPRTKPEIEHQILATAISENPHLAEHYRLVKNPRQMRRTTLTSPWRLRRVNNFSTCRKSPV